MPKPKHPTTAQRVIEAYFATHRARAMRFRGRWPWLHEIRNDPLLAEAFIQDRSEGYRDSQLLRAWLAPDTGRPLAIIATIVIAAWLAGNVAALPLLLANSHRRNRRAGQ